MIIDNVRSGGKTWNLKKEGGEIILEVISNQFEDCVSLTEMPEEIFADRCDKGGVHVEYSDGRVETYRADNGGIEKVD